MEEYWIVDLDARLIERWHPDDARPEIRDETLAWMLAGGATGQLDVRWLFREIFEDPA